MYQQVIEELERNGVTMIDMVDILLRVQKPFIPDLTYEMCVDSIQSVLQKREAQYAILTGIELDRLAHEGKIKSPIGDIIRKDEGRYGVDEILALSIVNIYGSIGLTTFGFLDKTKPGVIGKLDGKVGVCQTFLDDLVSAIIAAAASRLAHKY